MRFIRNLHKQAFICWCIFVNKNKIVNFIQVKLYESKILRPLSLIYNQKSGFHAAQQDEQYERLMTFWTQYGFEIQVLS